MTRPRTSAAPDRHRFVRDDIAHQPSVPATSSRATTTAARRAGCSPGPLHLAGLDPEAPDLHLVIHAAQELQVPVRQPPRQVARPVEAFRAHPQRVGDEPLGRQLLTVHIAACQTRPQWTRGPATPTGTGSIASSSTNSCVLASGRPIGTDHAPLPHTGATA